MVDTTLTASVMQRASPAPHIFWTSLGGLSLRLSLSGSGKSSLVLIHELGGNLECWRDVADLVGDACRVLRYDQRGAGLSEKPRRAFTLDDHVDDLLQATLAAGLTPPFHLVGLAAGSAIAVGFALKHSQKVASLVLCCPALSIDPGRRAYLSERADLARSQGMRALIESSLERTFPPEFRQDAERLERYRAIFLSNDPVSYGLASLALTEVDLESRLQDLTTPCLFLSGRGDLMRSPDYVKTLAMKTPGAACAVLESGHIMSIQAPEAVAEQIKVFCTVQRSISSQA